MGSKVLSGHDVLAAGFLTLKASKGGTIISGELPRGSSHKNGSNSFISLCAHVFRDILHFDFFGLSCACELENVVTRSTR